MTVRRLVVSGSSIVPSATVAVPDSIFVRVDSCLKYHPGSVPGENRTDVRIVVRICTVCIPPPRQTGKDGERPWARVTPMWTLPLPSETQSELSDLRWPIMSSRGCPLRCRRPGLVHSSPITSLTKAIQVTALLASSTSGGLNATCSAHQRKRNGVRVAGSA